MIRAKTQNKSKKSKAKKATKPSQRSVAGQKALGTDRQGPQSLKTEQFATYAPMTTFSVAQGTTPGGVRIRGRELIASVASGSTTLVFGANNSANAGQIPVSPVSCPRLNSYTTLYEYYKFHKCKAIFQSSQPTTVAGISMLSVDYDPKDSAPTSSIAMMRNISSSMSNIYADNACDVLGSLSRLPKFVTAEATSSDTAQVYQGVINYAFEGVVATAATMGYLILEYDVEFFTPQ